MKRYTKSIQKVNQDRENWDRVIGEAQALLVKAEKRAARLKGAIETFTDLRDRGHKFDGPQSAMEI